MRQFFRNKQILLSALCVYALLTSGLTPSTLYAQGAMTLEDCIQYALANHPDIKQAQLDIADADWQIKENTAVALPQLSVGADYSYYLQQPAVPAEAFGFEAPEGTKLTFALKHNLAGNVRLDQLLFDNTYLKGIKAAKEYRTYVGLSMEAVKVEVRNNITNAYIPALIITESLDILDKNIEVQEMLLKETSAFFEAGFTEQLDVDRIEYGKSVLQNERDNLARQYEIVVDALQFAMHMPVNEEITLEDDLTELLQLNADANPYDSIDLMDREEYVTLLKARDLSEIQVQLYDNYWLPKLSVFASYNPGYQGNDEWFWIPSAIVGASVKIPIYDGGLFRAKKERAMVTVAEVDLNRRVMEQAFDLELETAKKQLASAELLVQSEQKNLDLAQRIYDTAETKFESGVGSSVELTQALSGLYRSNASMLQARYDLLVARIALKRALSK